VQLASMQRPALLLLKRKHERASMLPVAHRRTVPLPPVRTTPAIFWRRSTFICGHG
jgi:hypothetical protein